MRSLILLLALVGCDAGIKELPSASHHGIWRVTLFTPDTDAKLLPVHGAVAHTWGMNGDSIVIVDRDAKTIRRIENLYEKPHVDHTSKLDSSSLDNLWVIATQAWNEEPHNGMPDVTDIREDLILLDRERAFYVSGTMLSIDGQGRLAAGKLFEELYRISE
jgi:hypothetical protein